MADEETTDDLRSLLSANFDEAMSSTSLADGVVAEPKVKADPVEAVETEADTEKADDRPRAKDGKFAKKEGDDPEAKTKTKEKEEKTDPDKPEVKAEEKPEGEEKEAETKTDGKEPPARWSASDKAMFKLCPPQAQEFLLRRNAEQEREFTKRTTEIADLKREYEPVQKLFAPYSEQLKAKGLTPAGIIQRWADVETRLANGRGIEIVSGLVQGYNIDKAKLAQALGLQAGVAQEQQQVDPAATQHQDQALPPAVAAELAQLREAVNGIVSDRQRSYVTAAQQREAEAETQISNFKAAANEKGEALHPYFDEVEPAMIALASSYKASGQPIPDLPQLYETAVWANPSTRAALLATQQAAQEAKRTEEARAKAASARRAASSVTGAPGSGQSARPVRSDIGLREQLEEAFSDLS